MDKSTLPPEKQSYDPVAKSFHWVIALLIIGLLALGLYMGSVEFSPFKLKLYGWHKSFGFVVLVLIALRLSWRLSHRYPQSLPSHMKWEKILAKLTHFALYFCAFAMPLSGWAMSSASGHGAQIFGLFNLPAIMPESKDLDHLFEEIHEITAWGLMGLIALHFVGAVKHHIIDKDSTIKRMLPFVKPALILGALGVLLWPTSQAHAATKWALYPAGSSIAFSGVQRGEIFSGTFFDWDADITFSADDLAHSSVLAKIDTDKVSSKLAEVAQYVTASAWLDSKQYPQASFKSTSFEQVDETHFIVTGDFTLKGVTKQISFPFILDKGEDDKTVMTAEFPINRLDYGVGSGDWADTTFVGDEIMIKLHISAEPEA